MLLLLLLMVCDAAVAIGFGSCGVSSLFSLLFLLMMIIEVVVMLNICYYYFIVIAFRTFMTDMKKRLGNNWDRAIEDNMTYGDSATPYTIVTFFNSAVASMNNDSNKVTATEWNAYQEKASSRYNLFKFQTTASHSMPKQFRARLLHRIDLRKGDHCLEIGCGVPKLSLDMAALSKVPVIMLDIGVLSLVEISFLCLF